MVQGSIFKPLAAEEAQAASFSFIQAIASGERAARLIVVKTLVFAKKSGMDSYLKKIIGQDRPDRLDNAAFGQRPLAAGEKIMIVLLILSK